MAARRAVSNCDLSWCTQCCWGETGLVTSRMRMLDLSESTNHLASTKQVVQDFDGGYNGKTVETKTTAATAAKLFMKVACQATKLSVHVLDFAVRKIWVVV